MIARPHIISVRLSEKEFEALMHLCSLTGARSASGGMRDAVYSVLERLKRDELSSGSLDEFRVGMKNLERKVEQLEAKITATSEN